ncbi:DUF1566 domain-containing protein [Catenovulum sp. SM1970]|uniref:Lcl C-terminal domain-containing protein n=1 Tax=Marinifaba aquimaris TaxID=2741323 RepID=UPI00157354D7|nr:DUF1566 domain-containing protein [Marinifaba aquimaris]NTS76495.1 DUF1566 domain-containing protein [Marinifaba aquimaris]
MKTVKSLILGCAFLSAPVFSAPVCYSSIVSASTPTSQYTIDSENGIATDEKTGLSWHMCTLGMAWDKANNTCTGTAQAYTWSEALIAAQDSEYANFSNWRLPNIKELMSIIERQCEAPALNAEVFVDSLSEKYWSSTPVINSDGNGGLIGDQVWAVNFTEGSNNFTVKTTYSFVRLVRKL